MGLDRAPIEFQTFYFSHVWLVPPNVQLVVHDLHLVVAKTAGQPKAGRLEPCSVQAVERVNAFPDHHTIQSAHENHHRRWLPVDGVDCDL